MSLRRKFSVTQPQSIASAVAAAEQRAAGPSGAGTSNSSPPLINLGEQQQGAQSIVVSSGLAGADVRDINEINPWSDVVPRSGAQAASSSASTSRRGTTRASSSHLTHRLSFDHGSGIIALPEDVNWLGEREEDEEESDSDEDYGQSTIGGGGLEGSQISMTASMISPGGGVRGEGGAGAGVGADGRTPSSPTSMSTTMTTAAKRYSTYYHHPERRRVTSHTHSPNAPPPRGATSSQA